MDKQTVVALLRKFNQWRKGEIDQWEAGSHVGPHPREISEAIDAACQMLEQEPAAQPVTAAVPASKTEPFLNFNLTQAMELVESFGGIDGDMAVSWFAKSVDVETGEPMPEGLYAYCYDYPEEGRQWLGDPLAEIEAGHPAAAQPAAVPDGYVAVKKDTVLWLLGENGEFECPPEQYFRGNPATYFWRRRLRADSLLGIKALSATRPSAPADDVVREVVRHKPECAKARWDRYQCDCGLDGMVRVPVVLTEAMYEAADNVYDSPHKLWAAILAASAQSSKKEGCDEPYQTAAQGRMG